MSNTIWWVENITALLKSALLQVNVIMLVVVFLAKSSTLPRIFLIFLEQHWFLVLEISTVQGKIRIARGNFHCSRRFEQCWFFFECWFKGPKIRLAQGKCWKNSGDQIYLKLNGISIDSRTGIRGNIFKPTDSFAQGVTVLHIFYCAHEIWTLLM